MPTSEELEAALGESQLALIEKVEALVPASDAKEATFLAKALEALKGTTSLQAILEAATSGRINVSVAEADAIAAILSERSDAVAAVTAQGDSELASLLAAYTTYLSNLQNAIAGSSVAIGEIVLRVIPDPASVADSFAICDGRNILTANCPALIEAWGIGGTVCPMIANYNATTNSGALVAITGPNLRLPNLTNAVFRARGTTHVGKYEADALPADVLITNGPATYPFYLPSGSSPNTLVEFNVNADSQVKVRSYGAIPMVRYK